MSHRQKGCALKDAQVSDRQRCAQRLRLKPVCALRAHPGVLLLLRSHSKLFTLNNCSQIEAKLVTWTRSKSTARKPSVTQNKAVSREAEARGRAQSWGESKYHKEREDTKVPGPDRKKKSLDAFYP